jgi:leucyl aminopeptidase
VPQPVPVARDRAAEIDAAIAAVTGSSGPVQVRAGHRRHRRVEFIHRDDVGSTNSTWLPFGAELGELSANGATLRVGLGAAAGSSVENARRAGVAAGAQLDRGEVDVGFPAGSPALIAALVDGMATGYVQADPVTLLVEPDAYSAAAAGVLAADTVRLARRLVSAPANTLTPARAADWAQQIARQAGLQCTVLDPSDISAQGFGALEAIGSGSPNGPRLVRLRYTPDRDAGPAGRTLSLVGKGITFDSGGLSLKSPAAMQAMRLDVAGAATVLSVMAALPRAGCAVTVTAVLPFAENLPGPQAVRPGDVVTAWNGTQIQILDSDFEGRVVLADALALAAAEHPDLLVDLATLTYQAEIALGPQIGALIARDDAAAAIVLRASEDCGEPMWRLPWAPRYLDQVRTPFGVRNHPLHDSGRALTAALFLGEFVPADVPWVHCDMTGPAWAGNASVDGATGFGARTLLRLVELI